MRGHPVRPRRQLRPFLRPFHAAAVRFSLLALDLPHRFRMRFPQRGPLPPVPSLQLRPKTPQHFRASPDRPADLSHSAAPLPPSPQAPQHSAAVFHQVLPLPLLTPVKRRPLPLVPPLQLPELLPPPPLIPRPVRALLRPLPGHPLPLRSTPSVPARRDRFPLLLLRVHLLPPVPPRRARDLILIGSYMEHVTQARSCAQGPSP